jgi:hypothetical protein
VARRHHLHSLAPLVLAVSLALPGSSSGAFETARFAETDPAAILLVPALQMLPAVLGSDGGSYGSNAIDVRPMHWARPTTTHPKYRTPHPASRPMAALGRLPLAPRPPPVR